ncbi:MAG: hypothetical protein COA85_11945 [Robiginitomaculum sp.]|nr:MAG: hypothetical protein COA85_11945 [Robiginitomaculum sp.]
MKTNFVSILVESCDAALWAGRRFFLVFSLLVLSTAGVFADGDKDYNGSKAHDAKARFNLSSGHTILLVAVRKKSESSAGGGNGSTAPNTPPGNGGLESTSPDESGTGGDKGYSGSRVRDARARLHLSSGHTVLLMAVRKKSESGIDGGNRLDDNVPTGLPAPHTLSATVTLAGDDENVPHDGNGEGRNGPEDTVSAGLPTPHTLTASLILAGNNDDLFPPAPPGGPGGMGGGNTPPGNGGGQKGDTDTGDVPHHIRYQVVTGSGLVEERPFLKCERAAYERYIGLVCAKLPSPTDAKVKLKTLIARMNGLADKYARNVKQGKTRVADALWAQWNALNIKRGTQTYRVQIANDNFDVCRMNAAVKAEKQCKQTPLPPGEGGSKGPDDTVPESTPPGSSNTPDDTVGGGNKANDYGIKASGCKKCDDEFLEGLRKQALEIHRKKIEFKKRGFSLEKYSENGAQIEKLKALDTPEDMISKTDDDIRALEARILIRRQAIEDNSLLAKEYKPQINKWEKEIKSIRKNRKKNQKKYQKKYDAAQKKITKLEKLQSKILTAMSSISKLNRALEVTKSMFEDCVKQCKTTDTGDKNGNENGEQLPISDLPDGNENNAGGGDKGLVPQHIRNQIVTGSGRNQSPGFDTQCKRSAYKSYTSKICNELPSTFALEQKLWTHVEAMNALTSQYNGLFHDLPDNGKSQRDAAVRWNKMERQRQALLARIDNNRKLHAQCRKDAATQAEEQCKQTPPPPGEGGSKGPDDTVPESTPPGSSSTPGDTSGGGDKANDYGIKASGCKECDDQYLKSLRMIAADIRQQERAISRRGYSGKMLSGIIERIFKLQKIDSPDFKVEAAKDWVEHRKEILRQEEETGNVSSISTEKDILNDAIKLREKTIKDVKINRKKYQKEYDAAQKKLTKLEKQKEAILAAMQTLSDSRKELAQTKVYFENCIKQCKKTDTGDAGGNGGGEKIPDLPDGGDIIDIGITDVINHGGNDPLNPDDPTIPDPGQQQNEADTISPVVIPPDPITVDAVDANGAPADSGQIPAFLAGARATDNVGVAGKITNNAPTFFFEVLPNTPAGHVTTVTFTARDAAGNEGRSSSTVTVIDRKAPDLTVPASITIMAPTGSTSVLADNSAISAFLGGASANDNVDGSTPAIAENPPASFPVGVSTKVTFSATDKANNRAEATRFITVQTADTTDTTSPTVTPPDPIIVAAVDASGTPTSNSAIQSFLAGARAADNVGVVGGISNDAPTLFFEVLPNTPTGHVTTVTFTARDAAGNIGSVSSTVTVQDQAPPTLLLPGDLTLTLSIGTTSFLATDPSFAGFFEGASATDNVDQTVTVTNDAPASFAVGSSPVTFTATDLAGNTSTGVAVVTVNPADATADTAAPTVIPPDPIIVAAVDASGTPTSNSAIQSFLNGASATDNVDPTVPITNDAPTLFFEVLPNTPAGHVTMVTFTARDAAGNEGTASSTVTVQDQEAPTLFLPGALTLTLPTGATSFLATDPSFTGFFEGASATDNVDLTVMVTNDAPTTFPVGLTIVTFSAVDEAGNAATGIATVTVTTSLSIDGTFPMSCTEGGGVAAKTPGQANAEMETILGQAFPTNPTAVVTGDINNFTISGLPPGSVSGTAFVSSTNADVVQSGNAQGTSSVNGKDLIQSTEPTWFLDGTGQLSFRWRIKAPGEGFSNQTLEARWDCTGFKM